MVFLNLTKKKTSFWLPVALDSFLRMIRCSANEVKRTDSNPKTNEQYETSCTPSFTHNDPPKLIEQPTNYVSQQPTNYVSQTEPHYFNHQPIVQSPAEQSIESNVHLNDKPIIDCTCSDDSQRSETEDEIDEDDEVILKFQFFCIFF